MNADPDDNRLLRHIYYISGFDPRGAGFLHGTCTRQCAQWSAAAEIPVTVGPRRTLDKSVQDWTLSARHGDHAVDTRFVFLGWDDIIRAHWPRHEGRTAWRSLLCFFETLVNGVYLRALRESWPFAVTLTAAAGKGLIGVALVLSILLAASALLVPSPFGYGLAILPLLAGAGLLIWARANLERYKPGWTSRIGLFSSHFAAGGVPELEDRIEIFARTIVEGIETGRPHEALIVGHSFGTALATLAMLRVLELRPQWGERDSPLALVTLGQIQSFIAHNPKAGWFRARLAGYQDHPHATWLDFSSPPDGACYALVNILDHLQPPPAELPVRLNAQFHKTFSPDRMAAARRNRLDMHFLYLMAPDHPQPRSDLYDFIALVGGPLTVRQRYGGRASGRPFFARASA